ncbi:transcription factor SPT20 homolog isoform X1 [Boleophthalmus pectinirostris]|uniref:transcription factor SPT20 homolog isoform X1 n=1 Tax=Boleophthalmus pectinirostris TaxID=150288 RepID=UPI000A1C716D|nr:transcription factor SPT20 homolog isoform X1 [Boleophthalmus pectinirostris]XP_055004898.1 transcription factor SPT20 homolog isoform X1 [Boleophthalmus pectinirostris]
MQQVLEYALDRAEYIVESARQRPAKRRISSGGRKSLYQKLYELYIEECEKEPELKNLRRNVNLLEKLVSQESVSCLVVNLYPGNEGYSLMLRGKNGSDSETIRLPYEEGELLEYLDAEELPPILVDLLEKSQVNIFHCGCVIVEVRDYRQSANTKMPTYQSRHILLRPTMQTLICDVHAMTSDHHKWTQDDKLQLESQLILATAEPLCLDPSISVTCTANRLLYNKQKMNTRSMKRCFKRHSRAALNRQQELSLLPVPPQLRLYDYLQKRKERKPAPVIDLKISKVGNCVDMWKQNNCQLTVPKEIDVEKYAVVEKSLQLEDSQPTTVIWPAEEVIDDYTFECEVGGQAQKTKVSIFQSMGDPLVYGKIYCAKEPKAEEDSSDLKLIHPPFLIGSKIDAERFLNQYKGVYERDVKCDVKMSHNSGSVGQGPPSPNKDNEGDSFSALVQTSLLGKGVRHKPPPIKMPSGSGSSSSGNPYNSQNTSGLLKCPTPPPAKSQSLNRKHSIELGQVGLLSPASLSPMGSTQRSGTPKPSTPTPTNTPCSTPHPADALTAPLSVTPTPSDSTLLQNQSQPALLPFAQQQLALSQPLPVMTIPLPTMGTSITTGTTSSQVMANAAGLNFINVVSSVCSPQTLMSGSNPMLGTGLNLSGLLPPTGLMPSAAQSGSPFGLNSSAGLRPLNLLQIPTGPLIFNSLQQQQLSQFSPQQSQSATSSPQQQGETDNQGADQSLGNQQTAVINLGSFMSPSAAVLSQLGCGLDGSGPPLPSPRLQQQHQPQIQLQFLQHQMQQQQQMALGAAAPAGGAPRQHTASQPRSKRKRSTPQPLPKT